MSSAAESMDPMAGMWNWLAVELRNQREKARGSQTDAGEIAGYSRKTVSGWEAGRSKPPLEALKKLDDAWNTRGVLARIHHYATVVQEPAKFMTFSEYEDQANVIRISAITWMPGLLQTPEYARAAFIAAGEPDVEEQLAKRLRRQEVLTRFNAPHVSVLLFEAVLLIIPQDIAQGQLERLLELSQLPNIGIRLVPLSAGLHDGLDGQFQIFRTPEREVGFVETSARGRLVTEEDDLRKLTVSFDRTSWVALSPDVTRTRLREMIEDLH